MGVRLDAPVQRHWSTQEVGQQRALAYWVDTVCDQFLELEIDTPQRHGFHASLDQVDLGPATANFFAADTQLVRRTTAKIARMRAPMFVLMQLRCGEVRFRQLGHEVRIARGECVFVDGTEPYELECLSPTKAVALRLPGDWLGGWLAQPQRHAGTLFSHRGWSSALCAFVGNLEVDSCDQLALPAEALAEPIATLLTMAIGPEQAASSREFILLNRLMTVLQNRLHESDLTPSTVAGALGISTRTVHYAFARAGTTFVQRLMELRLGRARDLLRNGRLLDLPVTEVAARCGFADPSHFARRFRRRFGLSPLEFRGSLARAKH